MTKKKESPIALELKNYEAKIKEFQDYLTKTNILYILDSLERHNEIRIQKDLMKDLGTMLAQLATLREQESKVTETRGDIPVNKRLL